jgi:dTDP-4-amino-4,6-dideoxy-D-galactose acyltransferase
MTSPAPTLRVLDWDSLFFGRRIATLLGAPRGPDDLAAVVEAANAQGVECVYVLSDLEDLAAVQALESAGARLVDVRMTFERGLAALAELDARAGIRPARPEDVPALRALAATSHGSSRFYADGRFPRELCDEMFATWIERSCGGWAETVQVADVDGLVCGYTTGHVRENGRGEIGLVAVDARAQGHGLGAKLVTATLRVLRERGATNATVVTQGRNIAAQRLYQAQGFRTQRVQTWHHLWLDEARP